MKFTNGFWRKRDGVTALHPVQAHEVDAGADSLTVYASTRRIGERGDIRRSVSGRAKRAETG